MVRKPAKTRFLQVAEGLLRTCVAVREIPGGIVQMPQSGTFSGNGPLTIEGGPRTVTDASFAADVERSPLPVLLDAWAPWCWPCQIVGPVVEEIAIEMAGRLRVGRVNVDENPSTTTRFEINSIPTLLLVERGREIDRISGVHTKAEITRWIARILRTASRATS